MQRPDVFILDDLADFSVVPTFYKDRPLNKEDARRLGYLSNRYPFIMVRENYVKALLVAGDMEQAKTVYAGILHCHPQHAKVYFMDLLETDPAIRTLKKSLQKEGRLPVIEKRGSQKAPDSPAYAEE